MIGLIVPSSTQKNPTRLTSPTLADSIGGAGSSQRGSRKPLLGEKSPLPLVAFLCLPFSAAIGRVNSVMAGCLGHGSSMAAPSAVFDPFSTRRPMSSKTLAAVIPSLLGATA